MKKIIIAVFMVTSIFIPNMAQAEAKWKQFPLNGTNEEKTAWADKTAQESLAEAEHLMGKIIVFNRDMKLNNILQTLSSSLITNHISDKTAREATLKLTKIYYSLDDGLTNTANKKRIIEIIGKTDNSPEAHEFFLKLLENGPQEYRERALWALSSNGVHGDDVYDKVKKLMDENIVSIKRFSYALKSANPQRALLEIREYIKITDDLEQFIKKGLILCEYKDPDVMDVIIDRYDYFKSKPMPSEYVKERYSAAGAIAYDMLYKYIEVKEGIRLQKAMEICEDMGIFGDEYLPILEKKLKSKDIVTRRAIVKFLSNRANLHSVKIENVKKALQDARNEEIDKGLKKELESAIKNLEK